MKTLRFAYRLKLSFGMPVTEHRFTLRCVPLSDVRQRIVSLEKRVAPRGALSEGTDQWGNALLYGSCTCAHTAFEAEVRGTAETGLLDSVPAEGPDYPFRYPTALTRPSEAVVRLADAVKEAEPMAYCTALTHAVYAAMTYRPGATDRRTTAAEALSGGCGVCQDYAHIMLAALRAKGIAARYAAGLVMGEGASHAWVEARVGGRWYAFDPTNDCLVTDRHIKLSHGRDADDCTINKGVFRGVAAQTQEISARVFEDGAEQ